MAKRTDKKMTRGTRDIQAFFILWLTFYAVYLAQSYMVLSLHHHHMHMKALMSYGPLITFLLALAFRRLYTGKPRKSRARVAA